MISTLPATLLHAVGQILGAALEIAPLLGGTNQHTWLVVRHPFRWVLRAEPEPALTLHRAVAAQDLAHACGVRVPQTIACQVCSTEQGDWFWSLETYISGGAFDVTLMGESAGQAAARDLGEQLRRLHSIEVDAFGDQPPRPYPVYDSALAWVQNKQRRIAPAVQLIGRDHAAAQTIGEIYDQLAGLYAGSARLAKGDCAGANLLVDDSQCVTMIDWEWAQGLDPAADIAYWQHFTPHPTLHAVLLDAYQPADRLRFEQRVFAYRILHSIELLHVYSDHVDAWSRDQRDALIRAEARTLHELLLRRRL